MGGLAPALVIAALSVLGLTFSLSLNVLPRVYEVHEGDVAPFSIRAPRKVSCVIKVQTRSARDQAAAQVPVIVELDYGLIAAQRRGLSELVQAISTARRAPADFEQRRATIRQATTPPLDEASAQQLTDMDEGRWTAIVGESQRLLADVLKDRVSEEAIEELQQTMPLRVTPTLPEADRALVMRLAIRFVRSNLLINDEATVQARRQARESAAPVVQFYERGQTVVRDGQVIGPQELEALEALGLATPTVDWRVVGGAGLLSLMLVSILGAYLWQFERDILYRYRRMLLLATVLVVTTLAAKMVIPSRPLWVYVFPLPAVAMLLATLLEARLAIVMGAVLSLMLAWVAGVSLEVAAIGLAGSTVAALAVWRKERLYSYFLAGVYVSLAMLAVYLAFFLATRSEDWPTLPLVAFELGVNGTLSSLLAVGSFTLVGRLFGILTTVQLMELANPTQPLLRRLLTEAPGTYHHSMMVANLAERAAEAVGADLLLVRVGAYYHDIGKLERPWAFIENQAQAGLGNIHDSLPPIESARLIGAHVPDGLKLAEKYGLPARVRDVIPQHHGSRPISFFYQQAAEQTSEPVDPKPFTYQGPRPQSREAAIVMLSDSTEAATRAARDHSREAIEALVDHIIRQRVQEGQLDDSDLTLRDLTRIKESFVILLTGIYHPRIPYPTPSGASPPASIPRFDAAE